MHVLMPVVEIDSDIFTSAALQAAHFQQPFRCALDVGYSTAGVVVMHGGHETVLGIKRDDIGAWPGFLLIAGIDTGLDAQREQCALGGIAL